MSHKYIFKIADKKEREEIYKIRHEVYAVELKQYQINNESKLTDDLDSFNIYIVAKKENKVIGFISITPPGYKYSMDKYIDRSNSPFTYTNELFEIRLLTVIKEFRKSKITLALMYASAKYIENIGESVVMILGRIGILDIYKKISFKSLEIEVTCGQVKYEVMQSTPTNIIKAIEKYEHLLNDIYKTVKWNIGIPFYNSTNCYHGGTFFNETSDSVINIEKIERVINADVLDAWFDPCPEIIKTIKKNTEWILKTSPPVHGKELIKKISKARNVSEDSILIHSGSSSIMYLAFSALLNKESKILILDPSYSEYLHILKNVIHCQVDRYELDKEKEYVPDIKELKYILSKKKYDFFIIVNPNNPTGKYIKKKDIISLINEINKSTRIWIDETYIEYAGGHSLEKHVTDYPNLLICKSMSKIYALSGVRIAYLCSHPFIIKQIKQFLPPWSVSLPAQIAGIISISNKTYYEKQYNTTHENRELFITKLKKIKGIKIIGGVINSVIVFIENRDINVIYKECKKLGLYIRPFFNVGKNFNDNFLRISIKDKDTNIKIYDIFKKVIENN